VYTESQGGNVSRVDVETGEAVRIRPVWRNEDDEDGRYFFNWNSPIVLSSHDPATIYIGADYLMRSRDRGQSWEQASPDLTRQIDRDTLEIFGRPLSEPHLSRNDGLSAYGTISTIDESPLDANVIWVGTDDGNVQVTSDGGDTWMNVADEIDGLPGPRYVSRIEASAHVSGRAYVTFDGHFDDDYAAYVFVTEDLGESWEALSNGLPAHSVNVVREHPRAPNLLFVGNEVGVYASVDRGESWQRMSGGLPTVPVDDLVIHPRDNDLVVGTHGRSIWIADDITPLESLSAELVGRAVHLFPVRRATLTVSNAGWPFWGDRFFGTNPEDGALIRYHLAADLDLESVSLTVLDASGDTIRTLDGPAEAGLRSVVWDLRYEAPYEPAPGEGGGFRGPPVGPTVAPGGYTLRLEAVGLVMEEPVEVRVDPRVSTTPVALERRQAALMDAYALARPVRDARQRITGLTEQLDEIGDELREHEAATDELRSRVDSLRADVRELNQDLGPASGAARVSFSVSGSFGAPTSDQLWQLDRGWEVLPEVVGRLNALLTDRVSALFAEVEALGVGRDAGEPLTVPRRPGG
jgi:hypothetical protein